MKHVIVIGAGQAAASFAAKYREFDQQTPVTIIGDEPTIPYQRPPLSKKYALGDMSEEQLYLRPKDWYEANNIELITGNFVRAIDRLEKTITLSDMRQLAWSKLVFATGANVRRLPQSVTHDLDGILYLRSLKDADQIGGAIAAGKRVLIVGGGYIGLEAAAVFASKNMHVTLVEASARILQRVACEETSDWFRQLHQDKGVVIKEGVGLERFDGENGRVNRAKLSDGSIIDLDVALIGIGIVPNDTLAAQTGLQTDNGIIVDAACRTSDKDIFAAGDCAIMSYEGQPTRLESVPNAIDQANIAAENAALDKDKAYLPKPWFWSDQYDVKLQIAGLNRGFDQIVVRDEKGVNARAHFYYKDGVLKAVDAMNAPRVYMIGKRLMEAGKSIAPEQAADPDFNLKSLL